MLRRARNFISKTWRKFLNIFLPTETATESKQKWNRLAKENARYFVMTDYGEKIDEPTFRASGQKDYQMLIEQDELLRQRLQPFKTKKVLEIGCGIGRLTEFLADNFNEVFGIDISEEMIEHGKKRLANKNNVRLAATDGLTFPFPDSNFDLVFSFIVFQHMPDIAIIRRNLKEIGRVLKPNGLAKIQLRGLPTSKKNWFYGPAFARRDAEKLIVSLPLTIIKTEGENQRYFWLWLEKH
ncbi:MAG: hypothetical protein A3D52_00490 [Candidatus Taylorbacteria bacterium RIFCSPHIGHO2_02_FULL_44_36]|uniref:Methyltransferase domain-containing protein n=1 Tax=Candidatus Taylorbacteria bacterium RIFCSPLOWO2_12_FULL_44_15c TaxID=1802333 RepID=A0A1G2P497_9BACT|nr:MAG: hypothetical protein A3D52_00490 [Candidatus Taylorbacteria bacterium RIFCSPHIGHO2_02_FULL_44_36]OHA43168.1 MAG: hypothetical protein A3G03_01720 [Candidatus Taylorbacteria bacterium RIFCSPLOWO2_12_FULL_44_15c]